MYDFNDLKKIDPISSFADEIEKAGLGRPDILGTGNIERFHTPEDKIGQKSGWLVLYIEPDCSAGAFGSWKNGGGHGWASSSSPEAREKIQQAQAKAEIERARYRKEAQAKAAALWDRAGPADPAHPYLVAKGVKPYDIRQNGDKLIVPMRDKDGVIYSFQSIDPIGVKKNFTGGSVKGHYHTITGTTETIYLCEGYATGATVHEATGAQVIVAFDCGNLKVVAPLLSGRVVIAADNDHKTPGNPGLTAARATGLPFLFPEGIQGTDWNDLAAEKSLSAVRAILQPSQNKFSRRLILSEDLHTAFRNSLSLSFRVKGILPESSGLSLIYGAPGAYKSFLALDLGLSIATGHDWQEHPVRPCPVLYLAAEGQSGVLKRIEAWRQYHETEVSGFSLLPMPCLVDNPGELNDLIQTIPKDSVVFLDTLARSMLGDENSTLDMGRVVIACDRMRQETGAQVVIIHHQGKDETKGARGAIALTGATDTAFKVVKTKEFRQVTLICERQKDYDPFLPMFFDMDLVDTGFRTVDGEEVNSLVPVFNPDIQKVKKKTDEYVKGGAGIALKALKEAVREFGIDPPDSIKNKMSANYLPGDKVVAFDSWRDMSFRMGISDGESSAKRKAFLRAKEILFDKGLVKTFDGFFWWDK